MLDTRLRKRAFKTEEDRSKITKKSLDKQYKIIENIEIMIYRVEFGFIELHPRARGLDLHDGLGSTHFQIKNKKQSVLTLIISVLSFLLFFQNKKV